MDNKSMEKWIRSGKANKKSAFLNKSNVFYVEKEQIDKAVELAFNENIQLPQIQEILKVLAKQ
jgi:hypothetical protein